MALSKNEKYNFVGVSDLGEMNYNSCQNCSRAIRYVAELEKSDGNSVYVGTECAKTLSKYNISNDWSMIEQLNAMKTLSRAINLVNNGTEIKIWGSVAKNGLIIVGKNSKGTVLKINIDPLFDVFLQKNYAFIDSFINEVHSTKKVIVSGWCYNDVFTYQDTLKNQKN